MPAPFGHRSPDLQLPGPELSRGFSRSASGPEGQVMVALAPDGLTLARGRRGGLHWRRQRGQRVLRLGASRYPHFYVSCVMCSPERGQRRSCS